MPSAGRKFLRELFKALTGLAGAGILPGCGDCTQPNELLSKSNYLVARGQRPNYDLPIDTWTRNPRLEASVHDAVESIGVQMVIARYRLQCSPRPSTVGCSDCYICSDSFRVYQLAKFARCPDFGTMLIHLEIGPGSKTVAMTYWKTTQAARTPVRAPD
jgi:hypothetical protein